MTKDKFIKFIIDNRHKFVFFSYRGGMGGETICNYLTQETDYFYNETLITDMLTNKKHIFGKDNFYMGSERGDDRPTWQDRDNRGLFYDWMFADFFMNHSLYEPYTSGVNNCFTGLDSFKKYDIVHEWNVWYEKFYEISDNSKERCLGVNCVFGWDYIHGDSKWDYEWKDVDNEMDEILERFAAQDKPYLFRMHAITPMMKFMEGSIILDFNTNEWERYTSTLSEAKVFLGQLITAEEKKEAIREICNVYEDGNKFWVDTNLAPTEKDGDPQIALMHTREEADKMEQYILNYIGDELINDESWTLYFKTLDVIIYSEKYELNLDSFKSVYDLNIFVHALHMWRSFPMMLPFHMRDEILSWDADQSWGTKIDEPHHRDLFWPNAYKNNREWYDIINPQLYNFNDILNGTFVKDLFPYIDDKDYVDMITKWHNKNNALIDSHGITNYLPPYNLNYDDWLPRMQTLDWGEAPRHDWEIKNEYYHQNKK